MNRLRGIRPPLANETREVTAAQLANGGRNRQGATVTTTRPRVRRTRRTPSQMSTTSLPVYMKEPGAQELVIFRGPEPMDASNAIAEAREAEDHDDEGDSTLMNRSETPESPVGHHPQNRDENAVSITSLLDPSPRGHHRNSSRDTVDSRSGLIEPPYEVPSEAPPGYDFEPGHRESSSLPSIIVPPGLSASPEPPASPPHQIVTVSPVTPESPQNNRRSRMASRVSNLLQFRNSSSISSIPSLTAPEGSARPLDTGVIPNAANSAISLNDPPVPQVTSPPHTVQQQQQQQHTRHRYSHSGGSSSTLNLALPFRTISRTRSRSSNNLNGVQAAASRSQVNLASPSSLSLSLASGTSPISAPLPHTLVRTEIHFPRGGPTPEQVKLLSSRDNPGRFGVPYGEQAIAHAEQSRLDLALDPPPVFESPATEDDSSASHHNEDEENPDALPSDLQQQAGINVASSSSISLTRSRSPERWQDTWQDSASHIDSARIIVPLFM